MAEHAYSITASAMQDDFDEALSEAHIMGQLADAAISTTAAPSAALFDWPIDELQGRLERIEVADMTMRKVRALHFLETIQR